MKDWMLTDEQMDKAYILGSYEGDKFGHSAIAKAQAHKIVEHIEENMIAETKHNLSLHFVLLDRAKWQEFRKDVEL